MRTLARFVVVCWCSDSYQQTTHSSVIVNLCIIWLVVVRRILAGLLHALSTRETSGSKCGATSWMVTHTSTSSTVGMSYGGKTSSGKSTNVQAASKTRGSVTYAPQPETASNVFGAAACTTHHLPR